MAVPVAFVTPRLRTAIAMRDAGALVVMHGAGYCEYYCYCYCYYYYSTTTTLLPVSPVAEV